MSPKYAAIIGVLLLAAMPASAQTRTREMVTAGNVHIDVITEGRGPVIVLLPSRGRDSEDYDEVAAGIAKAGYRVLRPQPRGMGASTGPMDGLTLHDLAGDVATTIEHAGQGPAVIVGHAYGNWIARMTAVDHPRLVRGVIIAAAAAKSYPPELSEAVTKSGDPSLLDAERLKYLRYAFFAPGHDAAVWLTGWHPVASKSQGLAAQATKQAEWWSGGTVPLLDLQAELDPFKPRDKTNEMRDEFGSRVTVATIANAGHALMPEQPDAVVAAIVAWVKKLP